MINTLTLLLLYQLVGELLVRALGLPIPGSAALVGQILPMQAAVVDLALATITLSRGVEVTVQ